MAGMPFGSPPVVSTRRLSPQTAVASSRPCGSYPGSFEDPPRGPRRGSLEQASNIIGFSARLRVSGDFEAPGGSFSASSARGGDAGERLVSELAHQGGRGGRGLLSRELSDGGVAEEAPGVGDELGQIVGFPGGASLRPVRRGMGSGWDLSRLQEEYAVFSSDLVVAAYQLAGEAHQGQWRKNGEPVLAHCVETAKILAQLNADETTVAAAMLHDVLDDTSVTPRQLGACTGGDVRDLVAKVGNVSRLSQLVRDSQATLEEVDYSKLKDMLVAVSDARVVLIKLADRLHNMRTLSALPKPKQLGVANETLRVFVPLAERLNAWTLKSELEDLAFGVLEPDRVAALKTEYDEVVRSRQDTELGKALERLMAALDEDGIEWQDISGRPKSLYGVAKKMERKGYEHVAEVPDLLALRVVVKSKVDCYAVLRKVQQLWKSVPGRLKDYIRTPKANGYQSIHEDVSTPDGATFEVQIRTDKMHYIAEHGLAAHWRYKEEDATGGEVSAFVAARTLWSQYVLGWVLEVNDKKLRPRGCGSPEGSIWKAGDTFADMDGRRTNGGQGCRHHAQPPPRPVMEDEFWEPLFVAVGGVGGLRICQLSRGCTLGQYMLTRVGRGWASGPLGMPTVNGEAVSAGYVLRFGDVLEFGDQGNRREGLDVYSMSGIANLNLGKDVGAIGSMGGSDTPREAVAG
ncbi:unnamed protein product [Ostreobium quekettii]|uniref:GTP diphosphokinase n=1 Tax=Ostreobium quekettii TaxID=121088 RepID=A0A8S1J3M2_9CHLO|nr:unnamed protein product [Ostreobium quekettii]|eukprot:evm.model.scf_2182EXC.1 EVM.evm.TU.scf_2182EXC.1   scf_2182EXC:14530-19688(-)